MVYIMSMNLGTIWSKKTSKKISNNINIKKTVTKSVTKHKSIPENRNNRSYWGTPTWFLFHTIAARINKNWYAQNYMIVWNFIKRCCGTLPCPFCRSHALAFVRGVNINRITTTKGLEDVIYQFHNVANTNSGKGQESRNVLEKYKKANIKQIFDLFENRFFKSYIGSRQFNDWQKNQFKKEFIDFFNIVRTKFD
jgi:hypothetical protein